MLFALCLGVKRVGTFFLPQIASLIEKRFKCMRYPFKDGLHRYPPWCQIKVIQVHFIVYKTRAYLQKSQRRKDKLWAELPPLNMNTKAWVSMHYILIVSWPGTQFGDQYDVKYHRLSMQDLNAGTTFFWKIDVVVKFHGPIKGLPQTSHVILVWSTRVCLWQPLNWNMEFHTSFMKKGNCSVPKTFIHVPDMYL